MMYCLGNTVFLFCWDGKNKCGGVCGVPLLANPLDYVLDSVLFLSHFYVRDSGDPIGELYARMNKVVLCATYDPKVLIFDMERIFGWAKGNKNQSCLTRLVLHALAHKQLNRSFFEHFFVLYHIVANVWVPK